MFFRQKDMFRLTEELCILKSLSVTFLIPATSARSSLYHRAAKIKLSERKFIAELNHQLIKNAIIGRNQDRNTLEKKKKLFSSLD